MLSGTTAHAHGEFSRQHLFISYSRSDGRAFAEEFERRIAAEGLPSWRDLKSVEGGEDIRPQVLRTIEATEYLVLALTRCSADFGAGGRAGVCRGWIPPRSATVQATV